jgi:hypothetical protein
LREGHCRDGAVVGGASPKAAIFLAMAAAYR